MGEAPPVLKPEAAYISGSMLSPPPVTHPTIVASAGGEDLVIEAIRGWAALMVMATHYVFMASPHAGMWGFASTGVNLFFVLSGYVFAPYMLGRPLAVVPHAVRRFFRLVPLYWCALATYVLLRAGAGGDTPYVWQHLLFLHTTESLEIATFYNPAFWSLPPEVEFYIALPLLAWLAARWGFGVVLGASLVAHFVLVGLTDPGQQAVTARALATIHLPGVLCEFALGACAAWCVRYVPSGRQRLVRLLCGILALGVLAWLYRAYIADDGTPRHPPLWLAGNFGLLAALAYALIVSSVAGLRWSLRPRRAAWLLVWGQVSYGVYLFHNAAPPALRLLGWTPGGSAGIMACVLLTLVWAWLLHHLLEAPMRSFGRALSRKLVGRKATA